MSMAFISNPIDMIIMNRGDIGRLRFHQNPPAPVPPAPPSNEDPKAKEPNGHVSTVHHCQTVDASKLCIYNACNKLIESGDYDIGGTYSGEEPELWFYFTTSFCHGNNHLLNLFVYHRKPGNFSVQVSGSNELTQKMSLDEEVPHILLSNHLTTPYTFKSTKPNQNYYIKTYCFSSELTLYNSASTMIIPVRITVNPKFVLNENIVKYIKLQHDLSGLLTKQEKTDFVLESSTHKQFPTHKILLAAHSPVLRNMIKNAKLKSLFIDISDNDMELLLEFIYTGTIKQVMQQDCLKLLEIADKFQLKPLFTLTQHVIGDQINVSNAVEMAVIAKKYSLEKLQNKVFDFIIKNPEVMKTDDWMNLKDVELTKYLFQYMHSLRE